ncbi:hypothetical protein [Desulfovibrio psychrotolerans]|uniref:Uncharacterized protein n=1 Tax=Desulfovibrio psychrotolerans TaxID=415242 RepID=A0A7J0BSB1_9BACT|nr:hypothetical protein [Desulfovibrio psychrotolerans]GFM36603.1 hypothetical protein DSM19430T_12870 [Desulfovibrio psychrotolerans]
MSFTRLHSHMLRHLQALTMHLEEQTPAHLSEHIPEHIPEQSHAQPVHMLHTALSALAGHAPVYDLLCTRKSPFFSHFSGTVVHPALNEDDIFSLLEDSLIFIREKTLRTSLLHATPFESKLLEWMECSGHWSPGDGTLFSTSFYFDIPLQIVREIMSQMPLVFSPSCYPVEITASSQQ